MVEVSVSWRLISISLVSSFSPRAFSVLAFSASFLFASSSSDVSYKLEVPLCYDSVTSFAVVFILDSLGLSVVASEPGWSMKVDKFKFLKTYCQS